MTEQWFATHAAGFGPVAARLAARDFPGSSIEADGDNALVISAPAAPRGGSPRGGAPLVLLSYCRGLFRVLGEARGGLEAAARAIAKGRPAFGPAQGGRGGAGRAERAERRTFVLRSFGPDDPASIPAPLRREIEILIERSTGLRPDSTRPDREFRLQERGDGRVLFLERVATGRSEPEPRRGELPRTTCRLLAEMTEPEADDVFLDPFCGYGGIALERALASPYRFVFAQDLDTEKVAAVKESLSGKGFEKRRKTFFPKARDALDPSAFEAGFVTAIATDPPWGLYEEGAADAAGAEALLGAFLAVAARALAPGGRLVLLVSRALGERALGDIRRIRSPAGSGGPAFAPRERLEVLVSGKKASALRLDRL
jgi:predicted RNA methylase